jgi:hypothetical protein
MRRVRNQVRIGRRFLLEKLPEQENRTRGDSIVPRHGCNRRRFQSHSRQNTMQLDRVHRPRRAENLHIEKKTKGQNRRPLSFSLRLLCDISVLRSLKNSLLSISLSFSPSPSLRLYSCRLSLGNIIKNSLRIYLTINLCVRLSLLLRPLTWEYSQELFI